MKKCPTCDRTFDDSLKFCQIDGTLLVDSASNDSFKTMVGSLISDEDEADSGQPNKSTSPFASNDPFGQTSFDDAPLSPFGSSDSSGFGASSSPQFKEPEPSFNQTPFGNPSVNQAEWTPPPAPMSEWQNQNFGANTPFQPPVGQNQNQTLPIVSLVLGILSVACCWLGFLTGPAALITGYMGRNNANNNPAEYGGSGLALAGMITGGIGTLISIAYFLLIVIGLVASPR